jgi:hypothetical protein
MIFGIRAHGHAVRIWRQGAMRSGVAPPVCPMQGALTATGRRKGNSPLLTSGTRWP